MGFWEDSFISWISQLRWACEIKKYPTAPLLTPSFCTRFYLLWGWEGTPQLHLLFVPLQWRSTTYLPANHTYLELSLIWFIACRQRTLLSILLQYSVLHMPICLQGGRKYLLHKRHGSTTWAGDCRDPWSGAQTGICIYVSCQHTFGSATPSTPCVSIRRRIRFSISSPSSNAGQGPLFCADPDGGIAFWSVQGLICGNWLAGQISACWRLLDWERFRLLGGLIWLGEWLTQSAIELLEERGFFSRFDQRSGSLLLPPKFITAAFSYRPGRWSKRNPR